jgi:DNA-binding NarL/FixJ family response regulator
MKVFLVEDSQLLRERLATLLAAIPGAVLVGHAASVREALAGIRAAAPQVVVLDIQLDGGSGFDVLRELQKDGPAVDVYMLTNFATESYRQAAQRYGARGFFDKSTQFDTLRDVLAARAAA